MPSLVVLDAEGTPAFVEAVLRAWDRGDAVVPLDPRLPAPARSSVLAGVRLDEPVESGDALVVATSGTSGRAKAVVLTHDALHAAALAVSRRLHVDPSADRWLACLPLAHIAGMAVVTRALVTGTPLEVHPSFEPAAVEASTATLVSLVPTMADRVVTDGFRAVLVGGAPDWRGRAANVVRTYGSTETGGGVAHDGVPLDGVDIRVGDRDEVFVRGPMLLRCYRDGTDPKDDRGWLPTGDAGRLDPQGRLRVLGRLSDVIVTGAEKVWPAHVASVLRSHPAVEEVAVAGRRDPEWGERVVAWVVPREPGNPPTLESLRQAVKAALPAFAAPRELVVVDRLPRTASGKVSAPSEARQTR